MFKKMAGKFAAICSVCMSFALLVIANTNSSYLAHQEKAPTSIERYSRIR